MAVETRYSRQMAFVGTETQYARLKAEADKKKVSLAAVVRAAIDYRYALVDGEEPEGNEQVTGTVAPAAAPAGATSVQFTGPRP